MALPPLKRPDGKPSKGPGGRPVTSGADCCDCEPGGDGPCRCGQIVDASGSCGSPDDPGRPNGPWPGFTLRIQGALTLSASVVQTSGGSPITIYRHDEREYLFDLSYIRYSQSNSGGCTSEAPGLFPLTGEPVSLITLQPQVFQGQDRGTFGWTRDAANQTSATVGSRAGFSAEIVDGWYESGPANYQSPQTGGVAINIDFDISLPNQLGLTSTEGLAAWSSGTPLVTRSRTAGLLRGAATLAQLRQSFTQVTSASMVGTQTLGRSACIFSIDHTVSAGYSAYVGSDPNNRTSWNMSASWQYTVSAALARCQQALGGPLGPGIDPAVDAVFREYGKCRGCGDGNPMA